MKPLELLRYKWKPQALRMLLAAAADAGPVSVAEWAARSGVPRNHVLETLRECERLGGVTLEPRAGEGVAVYVQPESFWRVTECMSRAEWEQAWKRMAVGQRLALATESMSLGQALAEPESMSMIGRMRAAADGVPDSGTALPDSGKVHPESGRPSSGIRTGRDHGTEHDHASDHEKTPRACLNHDHAISGIRKGTGDREQARAMILQYLTALRPGAAELWERRVMEDADLVVFSIEEAAARRHFVTNLAGYANSVYLSRLRLRLKA
jgi:hypothetical protein